MSRFGIAAVALAVAVALFFAGRLTTGDSFPSDSSAEAGFARDMSLHHYQAVEMAEIARKEPVNEQIRQMAVDIVLTQENQIGQMHGWLGVWNLPISSNEPSMKWAGHSDGHMAGIATREQLNALADSTPPETEKQFLRLMIAHHEGGAEMAKAILVKSHEPVVRTLAQSIYDAQTAETETMKKMLLSLDSGAALPASGEHLH